MCFRVGSLFVYLKSACCLCCKIVEQSYAFTILTIEFSLLPCLLPPLSLPPLPLLSAPSAPIFLSAMSKTGCIGLADAAATGLDDVGGG